MTLRFTWDSHDTIATIIAVCWFFIGWDARGKRDARRVAKRYLEHVARREGPTP